MKKLGKFKYTIIFAATWLACLNFVLATSTLPTKYATTKEGAHDLYTFYECRGVMKTPQGYQCDWYEPHTIVYISITIGAAAFILAVTSLIKAGKSKT